MNRLVLCTLVCLVVGFGCRDSTAPETTLPVESSKSSYNAGELIRFTIRNTTGDTVWVDECALSLQHESAAGWEQVDGRDCPAVTPIRQLLPGARSTDSIASATNHPRGLYRGVVLVRTSIEPMRFNLWESNTFTLR